MEWGAQGGWLLPPLRPVWSLASHPSEASALCLQTGRIIPQCPHSEGTDCRRLGACTGLLLGTGIAPPCDIWVLRGTSTTRAVITSASIKANPPCMLRHALIQGCRSQLWSPCKQPPAAGRGAGPRPGTGNAERGSRTQPWCGVSWFSCYSATVLFQAPYGCPTPTQQKQSPGQGRVRAEPGEGRMGAWHPLLRLQSSRHAG